MNLAVLTEPGTENAYLGEHAELLIRSFRRLTGGDLVPPELKGVDRYRALYEAACGIVSHNTDIDPVFNYGNRTAQKLFQLEWAAFTRLPSRQSAEAQNRTERERLLERVNRDGYIEDYSGVRISSTGKRFRIKHAIVWNLIDDQGSYRGQAARFCEWERL